MKIMLASPRGFCAGVDRAIQIVEIVLRKYGKPVYVRHEIVHNRHVVDDLRKKGAVFVEELEEIPEEDVDRPVIFSAHGVPKSVPEQAKNLNIFYIDATCPLVTKVHKEAERYYAQGKQIILIGHKGHPEVAGTMGQLPEGRVVLVETAADVETVNVEDPDNLAYCTQTTLSVDDTAAIVDALHKRFPGIEGPRKEDICYATTNRQAAVKSMAAEIDALLVIGAPNSSNSRRLVEVGLAHGCSKAILVQSAEDLEWSWFEDVDKVGITAGASAPEILVENMIEALTQKFSTTVEEVGTIQEDVVFNIPRILRD